MTLKYLPDGFIIWRVELGRYESTQERIELFVAAPDLLTAHTAAMDFERETAAGDNLVMSIAVITDCILDATGKGE